MPSSDHGAHCRSYPPMINPPDSGRKYTSSDGSRIVGMSSGRPLGFSTRYSCAIGTTGTVTPASAPSSPANIPPALTTTSVSIEPLSVSTAVTRPRSVEMPVTRVCVASSAPRRLAPSASANVSWLGSTYPSVGRNAAPRTPSTDMGGNSSCASAAETSSSGRPNVFAEEACRAISSILSSDEASRSEPTSRQPVSSPTSASSVR